MMRFRNACQNSDRIGGGSGSARRAAMKSSWSSCKCVGFISL
jgi:hypothetical protein